jgi:Kdo2-lipid IVA lauroyltransferase/acyltransferase
MSRRMKPLENWVSRQAVRALLCLVRGAPDRAVLPLGTALGELAYALMRRHRCIARTNLERAFGATLSSAEIERMIRGSFRHLGQTMAEFMKMACWDGAEIERRVELRGTAWLEAALARGRGVIGVTAHYGNWELLAARLVRAGYPLHVIARDADDPATNVLLNRIRRGCGYQVISRQDALRPSLECLRRNEILAILLDQNTRRSEAYVDFFGHPAATAIGPAVLARRTGAALLPAFDRRLADGRHVTEILPPVTWDACPDDEQEILEITARLTHAIEMQIRGDPEQWLWIHNRWKRQQTPPGVASCQAAETVPKS